MRTILCSGVALLLISVFAGCKTSTAKQASEVRTREGSLLPPLPDGVTELKFSEFFVAPVGPLGLTLTDKLTGLDGKRVRMLGYMVQREGGVPGQFLFTAIPIQIHEHDSALADDLPPATVFVSVPTCRDREVPYAPGLMLLIGTLNVGQREEADGRISLVRLALNPPKVALRKKSFSKHAEHFTGRNP